MAEKKEIDAKSVSKQPVATVKTNSIKTSQSVAAIREQFKLEEERQIKHYANAKEDKVMRTIKDYEAKNLLVAEENTLDKLERKLGI